MKETTCAAANIKCDHPTLSSVTFLKPFMTGKLTLVMYRSVVTNNCGCLLLTEHYN